MLVETHGLRILIDASPDLRQQMLTHKISHLDAVLLTHQHYDHVGGIDDIRPFCAFGDLPIYTNHLTANDLQKDWTTASGPICIPGCRNLTCMPWIHNRFSLTV